ncbi:MAG: tRNA (adenosine(37)-N6)-threonylcarbamoyltransferase complex dimerization subunit type 1 TsaB [Thermoleophilaceae bacterium]
MTILGFDTSTAASSAAVLLASGELTESAPPPARLAERPAHASELMPAIHEVMERAGVGFGELDAIAVGVGPGTFTGLRIGVATARALAKANDLPLRGVSSLAALAAGMPAGPRLPVIDAKRGEVYAALFDGDDERWPPSALGIEALLERLRQVARAPLAAGDGSLRFRDQLQAAGVAVAPADSPFHVVSAGHLCRRALQAPDLAPEQVVPDYLREPDAVPR